MKEVHADRGSGQTFDHSPFDVLLRKQVDAAGLVDYAALSADPAQLDRYIANLGRADFSALGRDEKLALLINAYNAFTLRLILDHWQGGALASIKDIPASQRWKAVRWKIGASRWSLDQIEHQQIRAKFRDPRIHFALVCAAKGCPPLRAEAYVAARLEEQLADQTRRVHGDRRWLRYDAATNALQLTQLYQWYGGDFEQVAGSVPSYVARQVPGVAAALSRGQRPDLDWLDYDWSLNARR